MLSVVVIAFSLQAASVDPLAGEGERLGRLSTLFAVCEPYYAVNIDAGHRLAEDFRQRSADAGWTAGQRSAAYDRGRDLERAEIGIVMASSGVTLTEVARARASITSFSTVRSCTADAWTVATRLGTRSARR